MAKAIERRGVSDLAKRALQTTSQVFRYAITHGFATRKRVTGLAGSALLIPHFNKAPSAKSLASAIPPASSKSPTANGIASNSSRKEDTSAGTSTESSVKAPPQDSVQLAEHYW